jgi:hypothetical protein
VFEDELEVSALYRNMGKLIGIFKTHPKSYGLGCNPARRFAWCLGKLDFMCSPNKASARRAGAGTSAGASAGTSSSTGTGTGTSTSSSSSSSSSR